MHLMYYNQSYPGILPGEVLQGYVLLMQAKHNFQRDGRNSKRSRLTWLQAYTLKYILGGRKNFLWGRSYREGNGGAQLPLWLLKQQKENKNSSRSRHSNTAPPSPHEFSKIPTALVL